jgi:hypothetical protein
MELINWKWAVIILGKLINYLVFNPVVSLAIFLIVGLVIRSKLVNLLYNKYSKRR